MRFNKRHTVFISSTYEDLREERRAVQDVVLSAGDFPVQMENFPAADERQIEFIEPLIRSCDYYVLIVAGRYGTPDSDGISFTEKEYRYAVSLNIPILVMLHANPKKLSDENTENTDFGRENLKRFRKEIQNNRLRKTWIDMGELKLAVREALDHAKATKPAVGWVRGDSLAKVEVLEELNEVRRENDKFRDQIGNLEVELAMPEIPSAESLTEIDLLPVSNQVGFVSSAEGSFAKISSSWVDLFPAFRNNLVWDTSDWGGEIAFHIEVDKSCEQIGEAIAAEFANFATSGLFMLSKPSFERLKSYFEEVGLLNVEGETPFSELGNKLARRFVISNASSKGLQVLEGQIKKTVTESNSARSRDLNDEIPF